jgi:DNA-binding response OmpR family regulator
MTVLVVVTPDGARTAEAVARAWGDAADVVRRPDDAFDDLLDSAPAWELDIVVVACETDVDAGHRACRAVRVITAAPLCLVSPMRREADELLAFARGCDDYITTASPELLRARLDALAARGGRRRAQRMCAFGDLRLDPLMRTATVHGEPVALTRIEFDLLLALVAQQRRVIPRRELLEIGWPGYPPTGHVLDVHLSRLRRKLLSAGGPKIAEPVPGVGYRVGCAVSARSEPARALHDQAMLA